jgi:hypothetical protein
MWKKQRRCKGLNRFLVLFLRFSQRRLPANIRSNRIKSKLPKPAAVNYSTGMNELYF